MNAKHELYQREKGKENEISKTTKTSINDPKHKPTFICKILMI